MRIRFYAAEDKTEASIAHALRDGAGRHGDRVEVVPAKLAGFDPDVDVACIFGLKGKSRQIVDAYREGGRIALLFDKWLIRYPKISYRVCINAGHPLLYMQREPRPSDRLDRLGILLSMERRGGRRIVFAGGSQKYCDWHGLGDANEYAERVFSDIRDALPDRHGFELVYRPKPSWGGARAIVGTRLSTRDEMIGKVIADAYVLVTHGSSAAIDAIFHGVPAVTLGTCAATPMSGRTAADAANPVFPKRHALQKWAYALAYCQWTVNEFRSGEAWAFLRREIAAVSEGRHADSRLLPGP